jgi:hypothetical protein
MTYERLWLPDGTYRLLADNVTNSAQFSSVDSPGSVNDVTTTAPGSVVFPAQSAGGSTELSYVVTPGTTFASTLLPYPLRPQLDDGTDVVVQAGGGAAPSPIRLYSIANGGIAPETPDIACGVGAACSLPGFDALGSAPGISQDGSVVVFYGVLDAAAAPGYNTTPGPGIFASVGLPGGVRTLYRVAGVGGDITGFEPSASVAVNATRSALRADTVEFTAITAQGDEIYASMLNLPSDLANPRGTANLDPNTSTNPPAPGPTPVAWVGEVTSLGTITSLSAYHSLNNAGQIAFWIQTDAGTQAVLLAQRKAYSDYKDTANSRYINQYAAGAAYGLPAAEGEPGGNACGPSALTTLLNLFKVWSNNPLREDLKHIYDRTIIFTKDSKGKLHGNFSAEQANTNILARALWNIHNAVIGYGIGWIDEQLAKGN